MLPSKIDLTCNRLTVAAETVRYCCRIYEWSGLYVPVVHFRNIANVVKEPGPYILGATAECRGLFQAPGDVNLGFQSSS